ncbi:predicted protein [Phaeodactylum tricornutum CCAP 1055/1]|jgi:hypothetical protein|uniref:Uncharacterized protein n=2 Tax=Phaeodactylum tricornutum TaxID=2850 RepID=B5Y430_PHATC|nr:predicted protein [Phaeodactylum tricornutum CCAP 1055/1]ACI65238.1 predicted protein [Phaeodactylum tricornutum CCAP 1055/1]|eukprot:XP_002185768.1 predicted protein [Phaeodactylum tricornutum CCAP 1055/1]
MDRAVEDATPAEEWSQSLNATCNRLSTQYSNLLKSASSVTALAEENKHDPRAGGGHMISAQDPPPPPLAADVALASLQCQLASENICVATSHLLTLIRTLRLSLLLMDEDTIDAEESLQAQETKRMTEQAMTKAIQLEQQLMIQRQESLNR